MSELHPPHALLRPRIVVPFVLISLIWGSTWFAIKDQLDAAPPAWSVSLRFLLAAAGMAAFALWKGQSLRMERRGHVVALWVGVTQFFLNYNLVYIAELHLTSGVVAVLYALMIPLNAILGAMFLAQPITARFLLGSAIGLTGTALLLLHESRMADLHGQVWLGLVLSIGGIASASTANVLQALPSARGTPVAVMLAWAMFYGAIMDIAYAWATVGPPVFPTDARYLGGLAYLAILGSVVTFPLYFLLIREIGAGRAAYINAVVPVVAMVFSTLFEAYRWSLLAAAGAMLALLGMVIALRARRVL